MHIVRELIDPDADKVVRRLARHGFQAYLVGGCVRDLLLQRTPKDFDVATSATPKEIKQLFRNCRIIGRRFRLAHIFFGQKIIETSTFRANPRDGEESSESDELLIRRDNVFGTDTEDARRRDFTINGLFYDVEAEKVIDHVGGLEDLERRSVRTIGDPDIRFREDPVRMLRAVKFAARLDLEIEPATLAALLRHRGEVAKCAQPRVLEEVYRLLRSGAARRSMALLIETGLASVMCPQLTTLFAGAEGDALPPGPVIAPPVVVRAPVVATARPAPRHARLGTEETSWAEVWSSDGEAAGETAVDARVVPEPEEDATLDDAIDDDELEAAGAELDDELEPDTVDEEPDDEDFADADADDDLDDEEDDGFARPRDATASGSARIPLTAAALGARRPLAWAMLDQIDEQFRLGEELTNSLLLAVVCMPFVFEDLLGKGEHPGETDDVAMEVLHPLVRELQVARRDAERTRQILLTQRRLAPSPRRRGKPMSLVRRDFFHDALLAYQMMAVVAGLDASDVAYWSKLHAQGAHAEREPTTSVDGHGQVVERGKRRRRRRGGRRRRRTPAEEQGGEFGPSIA